jgi:tetratricopeptide (TPR) repeat protein
MRKQFSMKTILSGLLLFLFYLPGLAGEFNYSPLAKTAYENVMSLRFEEAYLQIAQLKREEPNNLVAYHIENYIDFFRIYISESKTEFNRLKKNKEARLKLIEQGDPNSPYFLFIQADIRLHWALARLKFEEYLTAFREVSKAFKLLEKNKEKFPDFMPNLKDLGILHAAVGTIPDNYKWGVKFLSGMEGTIEQGQGEIEEVLAYAKSNEFLFTNETTVLYAFLMLHLNNNDKAAWSALQSGDLEPEKNPLHTFIMANIAMRAGKNDEAIQLLTNRPRGEEFFDFPYLDFMLGSAKLRRADRDASFYFKKFLARFKGRNFIKEAYQKLAWQELINGNTSAYQKYMKTCLEKGSTVAGEDKNAEKEAKSGIIPDPILVKARLLFDGAYYQKAYDLVKDESSSSFSNKAHQLEFTYRKGRILHGLKEHDGAIKAYQETIKEGRNEGYFFACNSALQIGLIYEEQGQKNKAIQYFKECLKIKPDEYKTGLHHKAKAGLERLK